MVKFTILPVFVMAAMAAFAAAAGDADVDAKTDALADEDIDDIIEDADPDLDTGYGYYCTPGKLYCGHVLMDIGK